MALNYNKYNDLKNRFFSLDRYNEMLDLTLDDIVISMPDFHSFIYQYKDIFIEESFAFSTKTVTPVIFDVGANIGLASIYFSKSFPDAKIISIEADPHIYAYLEKNISKNSCDNVRLVCAAAWSSENELIFKQTGADAGHVVNEHDEQGIKIKAIDLNKLMQEHEKIDLLKMDIEGGEFELFPHIVPMLDRVENIILEVHTAVNESQKLSGIFKILEEKGFRYHIHQVNARKSPLINKKSAGWFDCQANIFAYRHK